MRSKRILFWGALALLLLTLGAALWLWTTDLGRFKDRIETGASEALGRDLSIGRLSIDFGSLIVLEAENLRLANPDWAANPELLHIDTLAAEIRLGALWSSLVGSGDTPLVVDFLRIDGLNLHAFRDTQGRHSFEFSATEPTETTARRNGTLPLVVLDGALESGTVVFDDASRDHPLRGRIETLVIGAAPGRDDDHNRDRDRDRDRENLDLAFTGTLNDQPLRLDSRFGPGEALVHGGTFEFSGAGQFGTLSIDADLSVDELFAPHRPTGTLHLDGPDIQEVEGLLGLEPRLTGAASFDLRAGIDDDHWTLAINSRIGEVELDLSSTANGLQSLDVLDADLRLVGPDLQALLRLAGIRNAPAEAFALEGSVRRNARSLSVENVSSVIGETTFDLQGEVDDFTNFRNSRLSLDVVGPDIASFRELLHLPGLAEGPFRMTVALEPNDSGRARVQGFVESSLGEGRVSGVIGDAPGYAGSEASLSVRGPNAQVVFDALGVAGFPPEAFSLDGDLTVEADGVGLHNLTLAGPFAARLVANGRVDYEVVSPGTVLDLTLSGDDIRASLDQVLPLNAGADLQTDIPSDPAPDPTSNTPSDPVRLAPWTGAFEAQTRLRATPAGLRFDAFEATVGDSTLRADALIPISGDLRGLDISFEGQGPDLSNLLGNVTALQIPPEAWFAAAHLRRVGDTLSVNNLDLRIAETALTGDVDVPWPPVAGNGAFELRANGPDLSRLLPSMGEFAPAASAFDLSASGAVDDGAWRLDQGALNVGSARLSLSGVLGTPPNFEGATLSVTSQVPDPAQLGRWNGEPLPSIPVALMLEARGSTRDIRIDSLALDLGASRIDGGMRFQRSGAQPRLEVDLASERLDLRPLLPEPVDPPSRAPASPAQGAGAGDGAGAGGGDGAARNESGSRAIPDVALPMETLAAQDLSVNVRIGELLTHRRIINDIELVAKAEQGALMLERYHSRGLRGELLARGQLSPQADGTASVSLHMDASNLVPIREAWLTADPATLPQINALARLTATGGDLRQLAASLDGDAVFYASEGVLPGEGLSLLNIGLLDFVITTVSLGTQSRQQDQLVCAAGRLKAEEGVVTMEPMSALKTQRLLVLAVGSVDLETEQLDLDFEIIPTRLLDVNIAEMANSFLRIGGTLAAPTTELDPKGTLLYGGAAAATAGLSIIAKGLWDRLRTSAKPCESLREAVISDAEKIRASATPQAPAESG